MKFINLLILFLIAYFGYRLLKPLFRFFSQQGQVKNKQKKNKQDDFQNKHRDKIEDAEYEEIE